MSGLRTVFGFTFRHSVTTTGYRVVTILLALLLFLAPAVSLPLVEYFGGDEVPSCEAQEVFIIDRTGTLDADWAMLNALPGEGIPMLRYTLFDDVETANAQAGPRTLLLVAETTMGQYSLCVLRPDNTALSGDDADAYADYVQTAFPYILLQSSQLTPKQLAELSLSVAETTLNEEAEPEDDMDFIREILGMLLPYLSIMLLYFMVLAYGQSVANSAIMEKTSKLMDTFLVSVKPRQMMLGKVLAITLSAILQLSILVAALVGGFAVGIALVKCINPESTMALVQFSGMLGTVSGLFTPAGIVLAILLMLSGFLLYCALAAIGGACASKPEELATTNVLFTLVLVASFLCCLFGGGIEGLSGAAFAWLDWVPFTAIMVTPSRVLLGTIPVWQACCSLAVSVLASVLLTMAAGKLYQMMSLYKGNPPTPKRILQMIREK